ncbi:uncharacterized protein AMSG_03273 [Thecamonas trahens ATCC 50062]|uniref:PARP catalytic domain-containing protein n=1 Tax=Thecamonas trahens ATCC 50062 TaxID=461836 RepID=A0A0L0D699_THETB|nr:hypothetical protein AMSG_03273 [Thecamonas trahens ATCC 50062]KNC46843.1 hypothetical protein AMSG_03273 [Thecamonas trahens ATCC 50062]|eukprot:XP_013760116.1 hypothetical protein AMSG_03273 [Thecamonas trahens ATCC 50062]
MLEVAGVNPVRIRKADGATRLVRTGESAELTAGDGFWLVRSLYWIALDGVDWGSSAGNAGRRISGLVPLGDRRGTSSVTGVSLEFAGLFGLDVLGNPDPQASGPEMCGDMVVEDVDAAFAQLAQDEALARKLAQDEKAAAPLPPLPEAQVQMAEDEALARALAEAEAEAEAEALRLEADRKMAAALEAALQKELANPRDVATLADAFVQRIFESMTKMGKSILKLQKLSSEVLETKFEVKWNEYMAVYGADSEEARPRLAFHGTRSSALASIAAKGLVVPGTEPGVKHRTDSGWYGRGVYFSPNFSVASAYASNSQVIVAAVVRGRVLSIPASDSTTYRGQPCEPGYDSHEAGNEWIMFQAEQILPLFLLTFAHGKRADGWAPEYLPGANALEKFEAKVAAKKKARKRKRAAIPLNMSPEEIAASPLNALTVAELKDELAARL